MINRKFIKKKKDSPKQSNSQSSRYNSQLAITYGTIDSVNEDGTCNILLVTGFIADNIKIPSTGWPGTDPVIGGITYPPEGTEVRIIHPIDDVNSGFIAPASLNTRNEDVVSELLGQGDKQILPGGWSITYDQTIGKYQLTNGSFVLIVDPDTSSVSYTDFEGNTIKSNGATLEINGTIEAARKGDTIKSTAAEDTAFWAWAVRYNVFNPAWIAALATLQAAGGSPAGVVAYATAMQALLATLGTIPTSLTGKITTGSSKVKVG